MTGPRPVPPVPAHPTAAPTAVPAGHPGPSAAPDPAAGGIRILADGWCDFCHGEGQVRAVTPGTDIGALVRCACTYRDRASQVLRAVHLLLARRGFPPTVREVSREVGMAPSTVAWWLGSLAREGRIWRRSGASRAIGPRR